MKYGLLVTSPVSNYKNIGDYVQSLAAKQFLKEDYCYVEKEAVSEFESEETVKVIMNAWYMWHPECWPPKPCIEPLLTSMHISHLTAKKMLANGGKEYLVKHGPVGCRDLDTKNILDDAGVPNYFSACLTLTLGYTYLHKGERNGYYFVDPYIPSVRYIVNGKSVFYPKNVFKGLWSFIKHPRKTCKLVNEHNYFRARIRLMSYYNAAMFYEAYSTLFDDEVIFGAEYLTHMVPVDENDNNDSLLKKAEELVCKYSKAKLVVTSRIHCGLPCLGLETPVLFVLNNEMESKENMFNAPGRFGGLIDFFNVIHYSNNKLWYEGDDVKGNKITKISTFKNKSNWVLYRDNLIKSVSNFIER